MTAAAGRTLVRDALLVTMAPDAGPPAIGDLVMVDGEVVVRDGRLTRIDEAAIRCELKERVPDYLAEHAGIEAKNRVFEPCFAEVHRRASLVDLGLDRSAGDMPAWRRKNKV